MRLLLASFLLLLVSPTLRAETPVFQDPWPADPDIRGEAVTFDSSSPFALTDVDEESPTTAQARLYLPPDASAEQPVPAVILLHGAGGVLSTRELTYGPQFAEQGVAALIINSFAPRRDFASGFFQRLFNVTEIMIVADAYAGLAYLDSLPQVDGSRVALIGFSYGGMASTLAAYTQVAEAFAPEGRRFVGHIAYYAPCIIRADETETTGAPVLLLNGGQDALLDPERCDEVVADLEGGGSEVELVVYPDAMHQWDGRARSPWRPRYTLAPCAYRLQASGRGIDESTGLGISSPFLRRASLALCASDSGYLIGRDDAVRLESNREVAEFLTGVFSR
ncbi:MAG: dienelactone hydrolase family protein [Pseudomonadota bacterium]